eukprot:4788326-Ditylum_brightwellii.AAC.1
MDHYMPQHMVMKELGVTRDQQKEGEVNKDYNSDDDGILEFVVGHDQKDQDSDAASDEDCNIEEEEEEEEKCGECKEGSPRMQVLD